MVLMVYPFRLYNSGSRRDVIKLMVYLFHLKNPKFFSTSSLPSTSFLSEEE
jgi:hypothetical protein